MCLPPQPPAACVYRASAEPVESRFVPLTTFGLFCQGINLTGAIVDVDVLIVGSVHSIGRRGVSRFAADLLARPAAKRGRASLRTTTR